MLRVLLITTSVLFLTAGVSAIDRDIPPTADEFASRLGWTFEDALDELGNPMNMFTFRGENPEWDNVVFYYPDHIYLFWFQDRVWQLRADQRWMGEIDGVRMGIERRQVEDLWGPPINSLDAEPTWTLPDRGYPSRIRLYFDSEGRLMDLYVYRSDW